MKLTPGSLLPKSLGDKAYRWRKRMQEKLIPPAADHVTSLSISLTVNGTTFSDVRRMSALKGTGSSLIGFAEDKVLKVEESRWELKRNDLDTEIRILRRLNTLGCHCAPKILWEGKTEDGKRAMIMERITGPKPSAADVLLAFIELKGAGVIHGDLRTSNALGNGEHAVLVDFDQSIEDPRVVQMNLNELIEYMDDTYPEHARICMPLKRQLQQWNWKGMTVNGKLDLKHVTLAGSGKSTHTGTGIYHSLDCMCVFVEGDRGLGARKYVLESIDVKGETFLDIGCNTGLLVRELLRRGAAKADGYEYSDKDALLGSIVNHSEGIFESTIIQKDMSKERIEGDYDTITIFSVLHHIRDMDHAAKEIRAHCKRVLIECRLKENGEAFVPEKGTWEKTNVWSFENVEELTAYLEKLLGLRFTKNYGMGDRNRYILEFRK